MVIFRPRSIEDLQSIRGTLIVVGKSSGCIEMSAELFSDIEFSEPTFYFIQLR